MPGKWARRFCFSKSSSAAAGSDFPAGHRMGCLRARDAIFRVPGHAEAPLRARVRLSDGRNRVLEGAGRHEGAIFR